MLNFDKMTVKAQEAIVRRRRNRGEPRKSGRRTGTLSCRVDPATDGVVPPLLARLGIRTETLAQEIAKEIARLPKVQGFAQQKMSRALNDVSGALLQGSHEL